eukprot:TRINITY_DN2052_c0_g1_i2.p2 TRINITY_DN2052_c0_g1~~TRINITY_DN2052_c0_g1_i2.p2  ORF type:complete len:158 (-),score=34.37 TRINITY_DN2052_c0_g1_i2:370-843(-)
MAEQPSTEMATIHVEGADLASSPSSVSSLPTARPSEIARSSLASETQPSVSLSIMSCMPSHTQRSADLPQSEANDNSKGYVAWTLDTVWYISSAILSGIDFVGEKLADMFGITSPKYKYVLDEYHRQQEAKAFAALDEKHDEIADEGTNHASGSGVV